MKKISVAQAFERARLWIGQRRFEQAQELLESVLKAEPENAIAPRSNENRKRSVAAVGFAVGSAIALILAPGREQTLLLLLSATTGILTYLCVGTGAS